MFDLTLIINLFSLVTNAINSKHQFVVLDNQMLAEKKFDFTLIINLFSLITNIRKR